ncbi:hypothetical protein N7478_007754 [Penicillium angulare]|uniref:uncharacterized protein n=1 Tax=Penicillium angulare TaxID=116970 RepID=UPI002540B15B|nr:uncharacterized protein N7478_007754 [Penicillium angulare]KAJ5272629.1 hypothetical protein N7478_007754 [Penicillium angulare]
MTDSDYQCQSGVDDFDLSPSDRDFVLCLLDASRTSLASNSEPESEPTSNRRGSFTSIPKPIRREESSISPRKRIQLPQINPQDYGPSGTQNNQQRLPLTQRGQFVSTDSSTESSTLILDLFEQLEDSWPSTSSLAVPSPPTSSVYFSVTEETENSFCEFPSPGFRNLLSTSLETNLVHHSFAHSYEQLIDRHSVDWDRESSIPNFKPTSDRIETRQTVCQTEEEAATSIVDKPSSSRATSPSPLSLPAPSLQESYPSSQSIKSQPQTRQRFTRRFKHRLSHMFGDRSVTL